RYRTPSETAGAVRMGSDPGGAVAQISQQVPWQLAAKAVTPPWSSPTYTTSPATEGLDSTPRFVTRAPQTYAPEFASRAVSPPPTSVRYSRPFANVGAAQTP